VQNLLLYTGTTDLCSHRNAPSVKLCREQV